MDNNVRSSPLSALLSPHGTITYGFLLVVIVVAIFASSIFTMLPPILPNQLSAFATFPGENGKIAFSSDRDGDYEIYVMNADGSGQTILTTKHSDLYSDWSPDGKKIAFIRDAILMVMNADGSGQTKIFTPGRAYDPSWSPDGKKIAFSTYDDGNNEIYVMNADGSGRTRLTTSPYDDRHPDWSPDGEKIAFSYYSEISVMNADGSGRTSLTSGPSLNYDPSWSPDGKKIAFVSHRDRNYEIYVMNADGSGQTNISNDIVAEDRPSWSPDGKKIAFERRYASGFEISVMNADGSGKIRLTNDGSRNCCADWGPAATTEPEEDITPPVITVPEDITEEATSPDGATVSFEATAEDDVDGPVDVECDHNSAETFPIGETVVTCNAEDLAGNSAEESFTIIVQDTTAPDVEITKAVDRRSRSGVEISDGGTTPINYIQITFQATDAVGIEKTECSLDGQPFTTCTSPVTYDRLSRSTHEFVVRATDAAGNTGEDEFSWTVGNPSGSAPGRQ